jgi:hypothetical protein
LKYGSLNLLEPSGPVQACAGIALPIIYKKSFSLLGHFSVLEIKQKV